MKQSSCSSRMAFSALACLGRWMRKPREHYPDLYEYAVVRLGTDLVLLNRKRDGTFEIKDKVVFHGGVGATLEMRLFSQKDLIRKLHNAGFSDVVFKTEAAEHYGIVFEGNWSLPLVARKGDFFLGRSAVLQLIEEHRAQTKSLNNIGLLRKQVELLETQMKADSRINRQNQGPSESIGIDRSADENGCRVTLAQARQLVGGRSEVPLDVAPVKPAVPAIRFELVMT